MTIDLSTCLAEVRKQLAVIGKRMFDKEGKNLFSNITTSSLENPVLQGYIDVGAQNVVTALADFSSTFSDNAIQVADPRWSSAIVNAVNGAVKSYVILFATGEYLAMVYPEIAKKYQADAAGMIVTVVNAAHAKLPPLQSESDFDDVSGSTITEIPEYTNQSEGFFYMEGRAHGILNPVFCIYDNTVSLVVGISGYYYYSPIREMALEHNGQTSYIESLSEKAVDILNTNYGASFTSSDTPSEVFTTPAVTMKIKNS